MGELGGLVGSAVHGVDDGDDEAVGRGVAGPVGDAVAHGVDATVTTAVALRAQAVTQYDVPRV